MNTLFVPRGAGLLSRGAGLLSKETVMRALGRVLFVFVGLAMVPASAVAQNAQASISGTVKDASGAVLPGVTVEASSPVLIEKVRTSV